ncbi:MAG: FliH/SctL family protein [Oceanibaculum nanhaiense]|uniref:FliH/SctL family protein n=1 Tax=Oceanibaculum nanhaiense TaxID=1909734 RepID=UPI0025A3C884|nr:FliH/SctL family protein [Oceanibaculum nanhaiense]MDM7946803.1 FliH/SctL family protein [Oceanibaculum nanhaiense]
MKPFLFERDFDIDPAELKRRREAERTAKRQAEQEAAEAVAEPPPPSYGQEELDQVAADSFQRGVEQGRAEAMTGIEQRLADSWQTVGDRFRQLQGAHQAALETLSTEVTELAYTMVRQISPTVAKTGGMQEIEAMIAEVFGSLRDEPRIMVRVHPDLVEQVRAKMAEIAADNAFEGQITVRPEPELSEGDCRLEWSEGGAERLQSDIWRRMAGALERLLGHPPRERTPPEVTAKEMPEPPADETRADLPPDPVTGPGDEDRQDAASPAAATTPQADSPEAPAPKRSPQDAT